MNGAKVLVVDDERDAAEVLARYLEAVGHRAVRAGSAEEATALLTAGRFDAVLTDIVLPGVTGLQALAGFRKLTSAPIFVMSGQSAEEVKTDALLLGATGFFPKPLDLAAVVAVLTALPEPGR